MTDHISKTIADLELRLATQQEEVSRLKRTINDLCSLDGRPPRYPDVEEKSNPTISSLRSDQFYGRPLATVVREFLEMRKTANLGPASVNEIYDTLIAGGFKFETSNELNAKRGLRVSLSKNSVTFHKLPNGEWGLLDWYPTAKLRAQRSAGEEPEGAEEEAEEEPETDGGEERPPAE